MCLQALRQVGTEAGVWRTFAGEPGYAQNRAAADLGDELRGRLTGLAGACPDDLGARAYRAAASQYPPLPAAKRAALPLASILEQTGHPAEAVPWALLCLDAAGDHNPIQATLRLAENQRTLAQIAAPTEPKVLAGALELLLRYFGGSVSPEPMKAALEAWIAAETAGLSGDMAACSDAFAVAREHLRDTALAPCVAIALSQWLQHLGYFVEAEAALPGRHTLTDEHLLQWHDMQQGRLLMSQGLFGEAADVLARAAGLPTSTIADHALLYRGECLECLGRWPEALSVYSALAHTTDAPEVAAKAAFWGHRLHDLAADYTPAFGKEAFYWGEDRQTKGQWDIYGERHAVICARLAPGSLVSGLDAPLPYRTYVADPEKHSWWWNWESVTPHPSLMPDPYWNSPTACNWDDGGEKQPIGTGPDLMVDLTIPEGEHRLSLYLVNDFNYYEPGREHTIYLLGEGSKVLAACPVRSFEGGVYHHFAVTGPRSLTVRIFRNLSMNTLLQAVLLDRIDTREGAMLDGEAFGPLGQRIRDANRTEAGLHYRGQKCTAQQRRDIVRHLVLHPSRGTLRQWQSLRLLNACGAGLCYEQQARHTLERETLDALGGADTQALWTATAEAQSQAGYRAGATRFTRCAVDLAETDPDLADGYLDVLSASVDRMVSLYDYYSGPPKEGQPRPHLGATDLPYALHLAERFTTEARQRLPEQEAAERILAMARRVQAGKVPQVAKQLFETVGMDNLRPADLYRYRRCCDDDQITVDILRKLLSAEHEHGVPGKSMLYVELVGALAIVGDYAGAEAELETFLAIENAAGNQANAVLNLATHAMLHGDKAFAKKWFEYLVEHFPGTHCADLATKYLDRGLTRPWEEKKP